VNWVERILMVTGASALGLLALFALSLWATPK
jgi:hypothetical protein